MCEDDPAIKVNILTGTSTRRPSSQDSSHEWFPRRRTQRTPPIAEITIDFIPLGPLGISNSLGSLGNESLVEILRRSMEEGELKRNPNIQIDIEKREYQGGENTTSCSICQAGFRQGESISTLNDCRHTFHHPCLVEWGKYNQVCPLCRKSIPVLEE